MIFVPWGEDKSCKDTIGLSFPKPILLMEFDVGGFQRACRNLPHLPIKDWYNQGLITVEPYVLPFQIGKFDPIERIIRPSKTISGMKELFYEFTGNFLAHLNKPDIATIMVDTGTLLYDVVCQGYLQELQEKQFPLDPKTGLGRDGKALRQQLQKEEFREPNSRIAAFAYHAKARGKHLVVTHHATDEYGVVKQSNGTYGSGPTGKRAMHGWKRWGHVADIVGRTYWDSATSKAMFEVELAEVQELKGMKFENPTFEMIDKVVKTFRGE